jgi:hypothetical protein
MSDSGPTSEAIDRLWTEIDRCEYELGDGLDELVRRPRPLGPFVLDWCGVAS